MRLLANTGRSDEALQQYHVLEEILRAELGVSPAARTTALYETIKAGDSVLPPAAPQQINDKPETLPSFLKKDVPTRSQPRDVFVSRQAQLTQLNTWLDSSLEGYGRVAFISGVAGSGKTTLMREFVRQAQHQHPEIVSVTGYCNAFTGVGDPYLPFREILAQMCGDIKTHWKAGAFDRHYSIRLWNTIPVMCKSLVKSGPDLIDMIVSGTRLMENLSIFKEENPPWYQNLAALVETRQEKGTGNLMQVNLFTQVAAVLNQVAGDSPLVLVIDDLQWADAGTVGMLFHLGKMIAESPVFLVGAYRPEEVEIQKEGAQHPIQPLLNEFKRDFGDITIELDQDARSSFVRDYLDSEPHAFDESFTNKVEAITGGHALFTVEVMRSLHEDGTLRKDRTGRWVTEREFKLDRLPAKILGVIGQRINRVPPEQQRILSMASVQGEQFAAEIVAAVAGMPVPKVVDILSNQLDRQHRLVHAEKISWQGQKSISRYRFRHHLFQKYLYDQLDEIELTGLHARVGEALEILAGAQVSEYAIQLARHFHQSNQFQKAIQYYQMAGARAAQMSGHIEAIGLLETALEILFSLPPSDERDEQEFGLQFQIGLSYQVTRGYAYPKVGEAFERARELSQKVGLTDQLITTLQLLMSYYSNIAEYEVAYELLEKLGELYVDGNAVNALQHNWGYAYLDLLQGRIDEALPKFHKALSYYDIKLLENIAEQIGLEPGLICQGWVAVCNAMMGYPEKSAENGKKVFEIAGHYGFPSFFADANWISAWASMDLQDYAAAGMYSEKALKLAQDHHYLLTESLCWLFKGRLASREGRFQDAVVDINRGLEICRMVGMITGQPNYLHGLAEAYWIAGEAEEGLEVISQAEKMIEETGEARCLADIYRIKGELLLQKDDQTGAEEAFLSAISVAKEQATRLFELEATKPLARLWHSQGKTAAAHKKLKEIVDWFTEGFDTPMLVEANALLIELERKL
jgi:tetratricopeptide (TPR) repeat protein